MNTQSVIAALLACAASSHAVAQDDQALMLAAKLNVGEKLAAECDKLKPGSLREYQANLKVIETALAGKVDVSAKARQKTEEIPELASAGYVQKFRKQPPEKQQENCAVTLANIKQDARDAAALPPVKK